jgi:phosphoglycerate kinase
MNKKTLHDLSNLEGKVVLTRVDFNVPLKDGQVSDVNRIKAALPTINHLIDNNAKVVLFTHLGRIASEEDKQSKSVKIVAEKLAEISGLPVKFVSATRGAELEEAIASMDNGSIVMFENTRFEDVKDGEVVKYESKNNEDLGKY